MLNLRELSLQFRNIFKHLLYCFIVMLFLSFKTEQYNVDVKIPICKSFVLRARHKSCFLRPDSGPCRADIVQWYFDAKQNKCYEFFWGGCQGNGNKFETKVDCYDYCWLNETVPVHKPYFCDLPFDYGTCFGHYTRWHWDKYYKVCKRRVYSGCGGNQNNFVSIDQCRASCLIQNAVSCPTRSKRKN